MEKRDELIDFYGYRSEIWSRAYQMMGQLLDKNFVADAIKKRQMSDIYIYGGGYLGIQFYRAVTPFINVLSVVDKSGQLKIKMDDIPVMDMNTFHSCYRGELVVITPLQYYREICDELQDLVRKDKILFLEEFGGE